MFRFPAPLSCFLAHRRWPRLALIVLLLPVAPLSSASSDVPQPPPFYAIKDARVVTVSGGTLERATVLLANGIIEAIGTDLAVPGDAWVLEGEGLTVYPGLIDALTVIGQKSEEPSAIRSDAGSLPGASQGPTIRGPEDRPKTTPWKAAADSLDSADARIEKWREAGFTTVVTAPSDGFFAGQAAVIDLAGEEPGDMVVATPVAQRINFDSSGGFRSYPGSLMGVISYLRQTFSDAEHYGTAIALYDADPRGRERPRHDRALEPIYQAMKTGMPFLAPANVGREIDRVLSLADEFSLNPIIVGGQGAYARIDELREAAIPVLIDLEWPEQERDRNPDSDVDFRDLYHRRMAVLTPARLAEAEVPFAFTSGSLSLPEKSFEGVRRAVEAGLAPEDAIDALTLGAAEILGVADRLGSVEVGKIANLVVASGDPWAEDTKIEAVFVDGHRFMERNERDEASVPPIEDPSGKWTLSVETPNGAIESTGDLEMDKSGRVTGELVSELGSVEIQDGRVSGTVLSFTIDRSVGERRLVASYRVELDGDYLEGSVSAAGTSLAVSGERTATSIAAGSDQTDSSGPDPSGPDPTITPPTVSLAELDEALKLYQGLVEELDTYAISNVTVWTLTGEPIVGGTVLVEDGKISAVGDDVKLPRNVRIIDGEGGHLIPGIIDAHSHIAIEGGVNEGTLAVTAMVGTGDVIQPDDVSIYRALAGGVTTINALHGSANPIGGRNAVIKLRWGKNARAMMFEGARPGIKFALGENPKRSRSFGPTPPRYPATRMGVMDVIREDFTAAREYQKAWQRYEREIEQGKEPIPPRIDYKLQTLVEILEGERLVHAHCYRADEILQLLRLAEEFGFRIATLQHVLEGYKVANEIAAHGAGASTFSDWWGYKVEAFDAIPYNAALMSERGILVSINSDSGEEMRHLNQEAAKSVKWGGMSEVEALALVTLNPAKQLRIDDRVGSIEVGKDADLVLYDGHPLSIFSVVQKTFIDGDLYFDLEHDRLRQAKIEELEARILGKSKDRQDGDEPGEGATDDPTPSTPATHPDIAFDKAESPFANHSSYSCQESH